MENQDIEQVMEMLKTMLANNQEQMLARMDTNRKTDKEEMNASTKTMLAEILEKADANMKTMQEKMDNNQAKADADRKTYQDMLAKIEANGEAIQELMVVKMNTTLEEMNASHKEMLARMERMMNTNQTDVKLKELTETVEKTHRECEEPTSADMKAFQETTVCHEATEADIEKIEPNSGTMQSVAEHQ
jgi:hypothetical protein